MNRNEKNHTLFVNSMVHKVGQLIDEISGGSYANTDEGKKFLKELRSGRTMLQKALQTRVESVDDKTKIWLQRTSMIMQLNFSYVKDAPRIMKNFLAEDRRIREEVAKQSGIEPIYLLAEEAMAHKCTGCDGSPKNAPGGCPMYEVLSLFQIPEFDEENPVCVYINDVIEDATTKIMTYQEKEINRLLEENAKLTGKVGHLKQASEKAENEIERLTNLVKKLENQAQNVEKKLETISGENEKLLLAKQDCEDRNQQLQIKLEEVKSNMEISKREAELFRAAAERGDKITGVISVFFDAMDLLRESVLPPMDNNE